LLHNSRQLAIDAITQRSYDLRGIRIGEPDTIRNI